MKKFIVTITLAIAIRMFTGTADSYSCDDAKNLNYFHDGSISFNCDDIDVTNHVVFNGTYYIEEPLKEWEQEDQKLKSFYTKSLEVKDVSPTPQ